jgi:hypothetical protein
MDPQLLISGSALACARKDFFCALKNLCQHPTTSSIRNRFTLYLDELMTAVDGGNWETEEKKALWALHSSLNEACGPRELPQVSPFVEELFEKDPSCLPLVAELREKHGVLYLGVIGQRTPVPIPSTTEVILRLKWSPAKLQLYHRLCDAFVQQIQEVDIVWFKWMSPQLAGDIGSIRANLLWKRLTPLDKYHMLSQMASHLKKLDLRGLKNHAPFTTALKSLLDFLSENEVAISIA